MRRSLVLFALASLAACQAPANTTGADQRSLLALVGDTVTVKLGESVRVDPAGLLVSFDSVLADSRCAPRMMCVWAGSVRVQLTLSENAGAGTRVKLESNAEPRSATFGAYEVTLLPTVSPGKGEPGPYVIQLLVARHVIDNGG